jgi:hypothetical protein
MRNDVQSDQPIDTPATPLVILSTDDDGVCVDDLCLPADARAERDEQEQAQ